MHLATLSIQAQQPSEDISDTPTQQLSSGFQPREMTPPSAKSNRFEKRSFKLIENLFVYSVREDMSTTVDFLHHPQYVQYRGVCGDQPCRQLTYGHNSLWFTEVGRPARVFGCSLRGIGCSVAVNLTNDAAVFGVAEFLHHRKGKLGKVVAWGLVAGQTAINARAAYYNKHVTLNERLYVPQGATNIKWYNLQ